MHEVAVGENADRRRHRLQQGLDARPVQRERLKPERACRRQRARSAQHAALHRARDVLERLAVRLYLALWP